MRMKGTRRSSTREPHGHPIPTKRLRSVMQTRPGRRQAVHLDQMASLSAR